MDSDHDVAGAEGARDGARRRCFRPRPVVIGRAGAGIVAYAVGAKITAIRTNGSKAWTHTSPALVRLLASGDVAGQPGVTVAINTDDTASVIDATGTITTKGTATGILAECLQPSPYGARQRHDIDPFGAGFP